MFIMEWEMKIAVVGSRELKNIVLDGHIPVEATMYSCRQDQIGYNFVFI